MFLYQKNGTNWNRENRKIVIGYDAKDYVNFKNVEVSEDDYLTIDTVIGNTGEEGEWHFQVTGSGEETNYEKECFQWEQRQKEGTVEEYFEGLPSCPCTRWQAQLDRRFWFGWRWGLSTSPNCATLVWSRRQSTIECCYDEDTGALQVGPKAGGSYKLYHPWFFSTESVTEDKQAYTYCCELSNQCSTFYTYRPSDDCSSYIPSRPSK